MGPGASDTQIVATMTDRVAHRGPDDQGLWCDAEAQIALGHRRLAIVDLSPAGHEPMVSASGRLVVVFNGEIYNHAQIRSQLDGEGRTPAGGWRGHSDIETFLEAVDHWGLDRALQASVGMFAIALWDRSQRRLSLVRDRFGEKPLYYGWVGSNLVFASELKSLTAHPSFEATIDREALTLLTERAYIPVPLSIYRGIYKLPPGIILTVEGGKVPPAPSHAPERPGIYGGFALNRYYDYRAVVRGGQDARFTSDEDALNALDVAMREAIAGQAVADVPVGVFLSGGIDSSTVAAFYQATSPIPIRSFSIGFAEAEYNEAEDAKRIATHLGTVHYEHYVTPQDALEVLPQLADMYDEPFADSSQIPTYLVSRFAKEHVTVALTGDAGDEMFGGYYHHTAVDALWSKLRRVPHAVRGLVAGGALVMPDPVLTFAARRAGLHEIAKDPVKLRTFLDITRARDLEELLQSFLDRWSGQPSIVLSGNRTRLRPDLDLGARAETLERITYYDAVSYMSDDILCKVDRAAMAVSLETRVPMLDHRVAAVAARIPAHMKVRGRTGKLPLRALLDRHVPTALTNRPKAGFAAPIDHWLRGPLREWAESLLDEAAMRNDGWFDAARVQHEWRHFQSDRRVSSARLWPILMFQDWQRQRRT